MISFDADTLIALIVEKKYGVQFNAKAEEKKKGILFRAKFKDKMCLIQLLLKLMIALSVTSEDLKYIQLHPMEGDRERRKPISSMQG